jgi:hypothetical protein
MKYHHDRLRREEPHQAIGGNTRSAYRASDRTATALPGLLLDGEGAAEDFEQARCTQPDPRDESSVPDAAQLGRPAS